ncbi:MAG: hypothetical protein C0625_02345 [Arcobacter sp.]|nr:MAG: hypothetical protein C0625_02345 [Arcobacter sp.]
MKNLLIIIFTIFLLAGCGPKTIVVPKDSSTKTKPVDVISEPEVIEPEVEFIEPVPVVVDENRVNRIAVIYPSKNVGPYAKSTISTISAFLLFNNVEFEIEAFDTYNENPDSIQRELINLNEKGFTKVIALFTQNGFNILNSLEESKNAKMYFPLINKSEIYTENSNFVFGGISYSKQFELLQTLSSGRNTMFYIKSHLGNKLKDSYLTSFNPGIIKEIERNSNRFKNIMNDKRIIGTTVLLNTPIIKTSIIMSQLTAYEVFPSKILSTQLNFNPLLLKLTQDRDRENFYIVNSIADVDNFIEEYSELLGSDIRYNWVDYSSLVGVNYLLNENESELIRTKVIDNQVDYEPTLYRTTSYGFQKVLTN